jgi:hypothetical protein
MPHAKSFVQPRTNNKQARHGTHRSERRFAVEYTVREVEWQVWCEALSRFNRTLPDNSPRLLEKGDIMNKKKGWRIAIVGILACGLLLTGRPATRNTEQSTNTMAQKEAAPAPAATPIDPATVATVSGTVKLDGTAPKAEDRHEPGSRLQGRQRS